MEQFREELGEPVSPMGQYFDSTLLSMNILVVLEFDAPIHDMQLVSYCKDAFISIPRFTSIMVRDHKGVKRWKQVEVKWEEHIIEPKFIDGMSLDAYDKHFYDYLSRIGMEKLPSSKPLWQVHAIKYPTSKAAGTLVLKFHHAIGDGYTLMGLLLSTLQRADNPSLPLSFPSQKPSKTHKFSLKKMSKFFSMPFNTISGFASSYRKTNFVEDDKSPIKKSGLDGVLESQPVKISDVIFSMDHIKEMKSNLGVTVNDVITGIIFYGIRLYMQDIDSRSRTLESTAVVAANVRNVKEYLSVQDMLKTKRVWGNNLTLFHVPMPKLKDSTIANPLLFVRKVHTSIKRKKNSFEALLSSMCLLMKNKFEGPEAIAKLFHKSLKSSSLAISNIIGPLEQMALANHPIRGFFYMVTGSPLNVGITIMSYMGMLRVTVITEDGFIDEQKLVQYLNKAYEILYRQVAKVNVPE